MKNKIEQKLQILLSVLLVITAMLVIILIAVIPEKNSVLENNTKNPVTAKNNTAFPKNSANNAKALPTPKSSDKSAAGESKINNTIKIKKTAENLKTQNKSIKTINTVSSNKNIQNNKTVKNTKPASYTKVKEKKLYFIIDDAGYSIDQLKAFLKVPVKFTVAVLPGLPHSAECAELIYKSGKQVFLHQPMEALGKNNPGPGAILLNMEEQEIEKILSDNLDSLPFVSGFNNHMGSAVTSNAEMMRVILKTAAAKKVIFTDSYTTADSKCKEVAQNLGITIAKRDVFLDNVDNREAIMDAINTGLKIAENKGHAVMIGHVWSSELANTMMEIYPGLIEEGFTLEEMSDLILGDM